MQPSQQARLVLSADPPHGIVHANEAWSALMGHPAEEAKMFSYTLMNVSELPSVFLPLFVKTSSQPHGRNSL